MAGLEPTVFYTQSRRVSRLRYIPPIKPTTLIVAVSYFHLKCKAKRLCDESVTTTERRRTVLLVVGSTKSASNSRKASTPIDLLTLVEYSERVNQRIRTKY